MQNARDPGLTRFPRPARRPPSAQPGLPPRPAYAQSADRPPAEPDAAVAAIVEKWSFEAALSLDEVIGYTKNGIKRPWPLFNLITDAWLAEYPNADIAYTNAGGVRQDIEAGEITIGDIYSVLRSTMCSSP